MARRVDLITAERVKLFLREVQNFPPVRHNKKFGNSDHFFGNHFL